MAIITIKNLRLRTMIGFQPWEKEKLQDVIINVELHYNADKAMQSDRVEDTVDYKTITKKIILAVEQASFHLLEKLAAVIVDIALEANNVESVKVEVDKPHALRFADSVAVSLTKNKPKH